MWVGLSTPKQERFMAEFVDVFDVRVMIGVGAAFDFHAGLKRQAPLWMQSSGLEWLFRFATEPRRLGSRYMRNNPLFIGRLFLQAFRLRQYPLE
jgi:N-acetylglucosaminyldiphosphoundecaprenol N-acetyl-beta-D-mannosaminyltransferase